MPSSIPFGILNVPRKPAWQGRWRSEGAMPLHNTHPEDVKAAVRKTGITLAELARRNGLSDSTTRKALYRPQPLR